MEIHKHGLAQQAMGAAPASGPSTSSSAKVTFLFYFLFIFETNLSSLELFIVIQFFSYTVIWRDP